MAVIVAVFEALAACSTDFCAKATTVLTQTTTMNIREELTSRFIDNLHTVSTDHAARNLALNPSSARAILFDRSSGIKAES